MVTKVKKQEYRNNSILSSDYEDYEHGGRIYSPWLTNQASCWVSRTYEYTIENYRDYSLVEANQERKEYYDYDFDYQYG